MKTRKKALDTSTIRKTAMHNVVIFKDTDATIRIHKSSRVQSCTNTTPHSLTKSDDHLFHSVHLFLTSVEAQVDFKERLL